MLYALVVQQLVMCPPSDFGGRRLGVRGCWWVPGKQEAGLASSLESRSCFLREITPKAFSILGAELE